MSQLIRKVLIVGGTYGNELTGIYLFKKWRQDLHLICRDHFEVDLLLANPEAVHQSRRFIDKDLNQCFSPKTLTDTEIEGFEVNRAQKLVEFIGVKNDCRYDLIIDLHTTASPVGINLKLTNIDTFHLNMADYVKQCMDHVSITTIMDTINEQHFLCALANQSIIVEFGPALDNTIDYTAIQETEQAVYHLLDFVNEWNKRVTDNEVRISKKDRTKQGKAKQEKLRKNTTKKHMKGEHTLFNQSASKGNKEIFYDSIMGKDYSQIKAGDVLFKMLDDTEIIYQGEQSVYINLMNDADFSDADQFVDLEKNKIYSTKPKK